MHNRLQAFGGAGKKVVFAHANGFPPGSYRQFIEPLLSHCELTAYKHRPLWSTRLPRNRLKWSYFADDLVNTLKATMTEPVWMMGHSLGAVIAMLAASKQPRLFRGLILIDPVFIPTRLVLAQRLVSRDKLSTLPIIRKALTRPNEFSDHQEAFDFHRSKRAFSAISDEGLWDYIYAGTQPNEAGGLQLAFAREWEAGVYASAPWVWPRLLRLRIPTLGLRGSTSDVLSPEALSRWSALQPAAELHTCPGGHLLPMEEPASTARYIIDFLARQAN